MFIYGITYIYELSGNCMYELLNLVLSLFGLAWVFLDTNFQCVQLRVVDCVIPDGFTCFIWLHLYPYVGTYNGMEYLKGWSDPCVTSMQHFCALCLPRLLVPHFSTDSLCFFFLLVNYAHTQWVLNVLHPIIIKIHVGEKEFENTCNVV